MLADHPYEQQGQRRSYAQLRYSEAEPGQQTCGPLWDPSSLRVRDPGTEAENLHVRERPQPDQGQDALLCLDRQDNRTSSKFVRGGPTRMTWVDHRARTHRVPLHRRERMKKDQMDEILPTSHLSISDGCVFPASNSGMTSNHPCLFLILPPVSSSPRNPSNFMSVLRLMSSGRSGYTANAWLTSLRVRSGCFLSFDLGDA